MRRIPFVLALASHLLALPAFAQEDPACPPPWAVCLTEDEKRTVGDSLRELKEIKESEAKLEVKDEIVIIRDWEDRVYVNGGSGKPIRATLRIGSTVERDMEVQLPVRAYYREEPPDPMFRLRIRAQAGLLVPSVLDSFKDGWDAGVGWDFMHLGPANLSAYTGIRSAGGGLGLDLTKNFGPYVGYSFVYDGLKSAVLAGTYISFN